MRNRVLMSFILVFVHFSLFGQIIEIDQIEKICAYIDQADANTLFLFDVDQVLIHSAQPAFQVATIERHRDLARKEFKKLGLTGEQKAIMVYLMLQETEAALIEEETPMYVQQLLDKGVKTIALTAALTGRFGDIENMTQQRFEALKGVGFDFSTSFPHVDAVVFEQFPEFLGGKPGFFKGVLASNSNYGPTKKGAVLRAFLDHVDWMPERVVFIDDKLENLVDVEQALDAEVEYVGLHYRAAERFPSEHVSEEEFVYRWKKLANKAIEHLEG